MKTFYDKSMFPDIFDDMSDYHNNDNYKFDIYSNTFNQYINAKLIDEEVDDLWWIKVDLIDIITEAFKYPPRNYIKYGFYGIYNQSKTFREKSGTFHVSKPPFARVSMTISTFNDISRRKKD